MICTDCGQEIHITPVSVQVAVSRKAPMPPRLKSQALRSNLLVWHRLHQECRSHRRANFDYGKSLGQQSH